jgi:hypothetical protein
MHSLGYNKEDAQFEAITSKKYEVIPSFSKGGSKVVSQFPTLSKETKKIRHQESIPTPQRKFRRETPSEVY